MSHNKQIKRKLRKVKSKARDFFDINDDGQVNTKEKVATAALALPGTAATGLVARKIIKNGGVREIADKVREAVQTGRIGEPPVAGGAAGAAVAKDKAEQNAPAVVAAAADGPRLASAMRTPQGLSDIMGSVSASVADVRAAVEAVAEGQLEHGEAIDETQAHLAALQTVLEAQGLIIDEDSSSRGIFWFRDDETGFAARITLAEILEETIAAPSVMVVIDDSTKEVSTGQTTLSGLSDQLTKMLTRTGRNYVTAGVKVTKVAKGTSAKFRAHQFVAMQRSLSLSAAVPADLGGGFRRNYVTGVHIDSAAVPLVDIRLIPFDETGAEIVVDSAGDFTISCNAQGVGDAFVLVVEEGKLTIGHSLSTLVAKLVTRWASTRGIGMQGIVALLTGYAKDNYTSESSTFLSQLATQLGTSTRP